MGRKPNTWCISEPRKDSHIVSLQLVPNVEKQPNPKGVTIRVACGQRIPVPKSGTGMFFGRPSCADCIKV